MHQDPKKKGFAGSGYGPEYARFAGLGAQFVATIGALTWIGWWVDRKLDTSPWFLLAGALAGSLGATIAVVKAATPPRKSPAKHDSKSDPSNR